VLAGVARDVPAEEDEECGRDAAGLYAAVDEFAEAFLGAEVAEDDTVEELTLEGF